jgi:DNA-binding PadR family transcriptional regulator
MSASQGERSAASIRSPVYWGLLGLLIESPGYGYGLIQRFEREYGEALPLTSDSHIYQGLDVLEKAGLVEGLTSKGGRQRRQPTPRYRATPQGVQAYAEMLRGRVRIERLRQRLFARQLAALASEPRLGLEILELYEQACVEEVRRADTGSHLGVGSSPSGDADSLAQALPAEQARLASEAELPWVSYARARFTELSKAKNAGSDGAA